MLREVFRTEPIKYKQVGYDLVGGSWGIYSLSCTPTTQSTGDLSIVMHGLIRTGPGGNDFDAHGWRYHSVTGKLIEEWTLYKFGGGFTGPNLIPEHLLSIRYITTARSGAFWGAEWANGHMWRLHYGNFVTVSLGEEIKDADKEKFWIIDEHVNYLHFEQEEPRGYFFPGTTFAIDDTSGNRFLSVAGGRPAGGVYSLVVYNWATGKWMYDIPMPGEIVNMVLEDASRCYCLLQNRVLVLVDYMRGEILGAAKIPPLVGGQPYGGDSGLDVIFDEVRMTWDHRNRRMLIIEKSPNDAAGKCTMRVQGFRMIPEPVRITVPIPLKVPRQGRTIPVLVQVVDDINQGINAYAVDAVVTGAGKLVGQPITDYNGNAIITVECDPPSDSYS